MIREVLCIKLHSMIFQAVFQFQDAMNLEFVGSVLLFIG